MGDLSRFILALAGAAALAGSAIAADYRADDAYPHYRGGGYGPGGIGGTGAALLDPWLAGTRAGQRLVLARFDRNHNGEIGSDRAGQANRWFRRFADRDRDLWLTDREIAMALRQLDAELR